MDTKKLLMATGASFLVMFLLGGLFHMVIIKDFFMSHAGLAGNVARKEPMLPFIALGCLVLSTLMSYLYPKGVEGESTAVQGLRFGMLIGILWVTPLTLILYGATTVYSKYVVIVDCGWHILEQGIGGVVIAMVYGKSLSKTS